MPISARASPPNRQASRLTRGKEEARTCARRSFAWRQPFSARRQTLGTGFTTRQVGPDAERWLTPLPDRRPTPAESANTSATDLVNSHGRSIAPRSSRTELRLLLEAFPRSRKIERIFFTAAV